MAARDAVRAADHAPGFGLLLEGLATHLIDGYVAAAPILKQGLRAYCDIQPDLNEDLHWNHLVVRVAIDLWDDQSWHELADRELRFVRESGAISSESPPDEIFGIRFPGRPNDSRPVASPSRATDRRTTGSLRDLVSELAVLVAAALPRCAVIGGSP